MRFASLGSGSSGNGTLIESDETLLLLDCGFTLKETEKRLQRLGVHPKDLSALLVTHEHADHAQGVGPLARKYSLSTYMTPGTFLSRNFGHLPQLQLVRGYQPFAIGNLSVTPVPVPHDAKEPAQFVFTGRDCRLGILTDLGAATPHIQACYAGCDGLFVEFNHDRDLLSSGPYPPALKRRVASHWGHLNNTQAAQLLASILAVNTRLVVIGHISQQNNTLPLVAAAAEQAVAGRDLRLLFASQNEGFSWLCLE